MEEPKVYTRYTSTDKEITGYYIYLNQNIFGRKLKLSIWLSLGCVVMMVVTLKVPEYIVSLASKLGVDIEKNF